MTCRFHVAPSTSLQQLMDFMENTPKKFFCKKVFWMLLKYLTQTISYFDHESHRNCVNYQKQFITPTISIDLLSYDHLKLMCFSHCDINIIKYMIKLELLAWLPFMPILISRDPPSLIFAFIVDPIFSSVIYWRQPWKSNKKCCASSLKDACLFM